MLKSWKFLRSISLMLFVMTPVLIAGCGGASNDDPGTEISVEEDETLDPANDSTMNPDAGGEATTE